MPEIVLDASALLALLNAEPGGDVVTESLPRAVISAVNLSEVIAKLAESGMPEKVVRQVLEPLGLDIAPFDEEQAYQAGLLRARTRELGLSLGDRACLSLGKILNAVVLTADTTWAKLTLGVTVKTIR
jgi:PIN domain nuclease of toxin-antitoxin system